MSRRKRHAQETSKEPAAPPAIREPLAGAELFRRYLLGLITALIVARPLVLGEDPGMSSRFTDTSNLLITLLWLIAATGWAIWHNIAGKGEWYVSIAEAGLLIAVIAALFSISSASYRLPAILIGWEWLAMFLALFVVRHLATTEADQRRLLAAMLASVVALSALAVNTAITGQVSDRPATIDPSTPRALPASAMACGPTAPSVASAGVAYCICSQIDLEDEFEAPWPVERNVPGETTEQEKRISGPYANPDNFAGLLVLTIPALAAAAVLRWRRRSEGGIALFWLTLLGVVLAAAALWFTRSWLAPLGLLTSALLLLPLFGGTWPIHRRPLAIALALVVAATILIGCLELTNPDWGSLKSHRRFMIIGVVIALAGYLFLVTWKSCTESESMPGEPDEAQQGTRWEFYFGGMAGLLLGYFLREMSESPDRVLEASATAADEMMGRGIISGLRAMLWFAVFALFEDVPWTRRARVLAITVGVGALGCTLVASGEVDLPSIAQLLWVSVALGLTAAPFAPHKLLPGNWFLRAIPIVLLLGLTVAYVNYVFSPLTAGVWDAATAMRAARPRLPERHPRSGALPGKSADFEKEVIAPLRAANEAESEQNARRNVQLARWYGELLHMDRDDRIRRINLRTQAIYHADRAIELDPRSPEGYLVRYWLARRIARVFRQFPGEMKAQNMTAAETLVPLISHDPDNPRWRYLRARALFDAGDYANARSAAQEAIDLQSDAAKPNRRLTSWEKLQAQTWLMAMPPN